MGVCFILGVYLNINTAMAIATVAVGVAGANGLEKGLENGKNN